MKRNRNPERKPQKFTTVGAEALTTVAEPKVNIIQPHHGWLSLDFREMWQYRELLYFLVWRDIKVRYKQTVLGAAWAVLQPVLSMLIFTVIFGRFARIPSEGVPYSIFVFAGLLPWTFFSTAVTQGSLSVVNQANLLTKIYFPRIFIPTASIGVALVDLCFSFAVYLFIMFWYSHWPGLYATLLPALLLLTMMAAAGFGYLLSSVTVIYRDFRHAVPFMIQIWLFVSPVVYPVTMLPENYRWIMALNPMCGLIGGFRSALLNKPMDWMSLTISSIVTVAIFLFGLYNFRRMERRFADMI
ncbi:MAG: ABC transporter permease [Acidobacteria bacterium]|nr:ABC transporter permease [Acidobacteriota bacterium]